jgi:Na+(H+)/acetate symporter ActP
MTMSGEDVPMKSNVVWGAIAFGVVLAIVVGLRLDQAALTAIVGVAFGVGASIPTGLLVIYLLRRKDTTDSAHRSRSQNYALGHTPSIVVVAPPAAPQLPQPAPWSGGSVSTVPSTRQFAVIGEEGIDDVFDY